MEATITSKGQVTLPKKLREKLGLKAGQKIIFFQRSDGSIGLKLRRQNLDSVAGIIKPQHGLGATIEMLTEAAQKASADSQSEHD